MEPMIIPVFWLYVNGALPQTREGYYPGPYSFNLAVCQKAIEEVRPKYPPGTRLDCVPHPYMNPAWRPPQQ